MQVVAGVDLGGTAINYTLVNEQEQFLIEELCEHPALSREGPEICLQQIAAGLEIAAALAGIPLDAVSVVGLDTPGPASADGVLSAKGSTNFVHANWAGFDLRQGLANKLGKPGVTSRSSAQVIEPRPSRRLSAPASAVASSPMATSSRVDEVMAESWATCSSPTRASPESAA